jgi:hypothetical protein
MPSYQTFDIKYLSIDAALKAGEHDFTTSSSIAVVLQLAGC